MAFKLAEAYVQLSSRGMGTVRRALGGIGRGLTALLNPAAMVGAALAGIGVGFGVSSMLQLAAATEVTAVSFEVLLRSAEKAKVMIEDINKFAAVTPFEQGELAGVAKQLLTAGVAQENIIDQLGQLGDIAAIAQTPLNELASAFGKAKGANVVMTEILDMFIDRGIPVTQALADVMNDLGITVNMAAGEVRQFAPTGKITFAVFEQALKNMTTRGGQFFEGMKKLSQTTAGLWSTFTGNLKLSLSRLGQTMIDTFDIKDLLRSLGTFFKDFSESVSDLSPKLEGVAEDVRLLKDLVFSLGGVFRDTAEGWAELRDIEIKDGVEDMGFMRDIVKDMSFTFRNWGDSMAMVWELATSGAQGFFLSMMTGWSAIGQAAMIAMDPRNWGNVGEKIEVMRKEMRQGWIDDMDALGTESTEQIDLLQSSINAREFARVRSRVPEKGEDGADGEDSAGGPPPTPDPGKVKDGKFRITSLAGLADQMQSEAGKRIAERNVEANIRTAVAVEKIAAEQGKGGESEKERQANLRLAAGSSMPPIPAPAFQ